MVSIPASHFPGENVHLECAYVWDGVTIEDRCTVQASVLDNSVHLKSGVTLQHGCVLAEKVRE